MGSHKVSMAQFEDFPPSNRRHVAAPQDQLGPGLAPRDEAKVIPVSLARTRLAHDGAELQEDPGSVSSMGKEGAGGASSMMSSYQAMQAGVSIEQKKRTGKKIVQPQQTGPTLFFGSGGPRTDPAAALELGTTKQSPHIPGYGGHIPKTATAGDAAPVRSMDKSLIVENYKPYGAGYTGRKT
ncbi:hypothetical protein Vretimale_9529 [Volvox reticuliferus]|uniref:Uncharacterized protein n=1 Tax=Volvox reticuliferus TaxID=1737510 RepID=A0A8J4LPX3_9CHLO|nr:hypothetical protein Vretifemale_18810 [Volvox reticuliferus]GIM05112.1 hypothetical protein Vretimale_9529 [Volvox reticuliferus]